MKKNSEEMGSKRSRSREIWTLFKRNKPAMVGLILFALIVLVAVFADVIVDNKLCYEFSGMPLEAPSAQHPFGTDNLGRDLFARIIHGSRYSLVIGISATVLSLAIGAFIGAACGYFGGWLDNVIMRIFDVIASIPGMLLIMVLVMALGVGVENLIYALLISGVPGYARLLLFPYFLPPAENISFPAPVQAYRVPVLWKYPPGTAWIPEYQTLSVYMPEFLFL